MEATIQQIDSQVTKSAQAEVAAQDAQAVLELSTLELSLVGGGVAAVIFA